MKTTIFVVDDFKDVRRDLCEKLRASFPHATISGFENPAQALDDLRARSSDTVKERSSTPGEQIIAIADLYISSYRGQPQVKGMADSQGSQKPMTRWTDIMSVVEHSLRHFWRPMVVDYGVKLIVYSHVRRYLQEEWKSDWNENIDHVIQRLTSAVRDNARVSDENFIDKNYSSVKPPTSDAQQQQLRDDLDIIVSKVRSALAEDAPQ